LQHVRTPIDLAKWAKEKRPESYKWRKHTMNKRRE
jgi:hypothetical protein